MAEDFYTTAKWRRKRRAILRRDGYQDQVLKRYGRLCEATIVHHVFPREEFPEYAFADWNLISVSMATHNRLEDRMNGELTPAGRDLLRRTARKNGVPIPDRYAEG